MPGMCKQAQNLQTNDQCNINVSYIHESALKAPGASGESLKGGDF